MVSYGGCLFFPSFILNWVTSQHIFLKVEIKQNGPNNKMLNSEPIYCNVAVSSTWVKYYKYIIYFF